MVKKAIHIIFICAIFLSNYIVGQDLMGNGYVSQGQSITETNKLTHVNSIVSSILHAIPGPTNQMNDIAFDGENIWVATTEFMLYKISPIDGEVLKAIPVDAAYGAGLTFLDGNLWLSDRSTSRLLKIDTTAGEIIKAFPLVQEVGISGLTAINGNVWINNHGDAFSHTFDDDTTFYHSITTGEKLNHYVPPGATATGLAFDGTYIWSSDNADLRIYQIDTSNYKAIGYFDAPGGNFPNGLTYDGKYLWVLDNGVDSLYQIDLSLVLSNNDQEEQQELLVYPNPSKAQVFFEIEAYTEHENLNLQVYNSTGIMVFTTRIDRSSKQTIVLDELKPGVYFYRLQTAHNQLAAGRFIQH